MVIFNRINVVTNKVITEKMYLRSLKQKACDVRQAVIFYFLQMLILSN